MSGINFARTYRWLSLTGLIAAGGCATSLQQNLDVLWSPNSVGSLMSAGQSAVLPLVRLLRLLF